MSQMNPNQAIFDSGYTFALVVAGGGMEVAGELTRYGGASSSLMEVHCLYSMDSIHDLLGSKPDKIVSKETARALAMLAYQGSKPFGENLDKFFGVGSTSSLVKQGEREGRIHEVFIVSQDMESTYEYHIKLKPGRTREEEESIVSKLIIRVIEESTGVITTPWDNLFLGILNHDDFVEIQHADEVRSNCNIFSIDVINYGDLDLSTFINVYSVFNGEAKFHPQPQNKLIFSSSCNPIHEGHIAIMEHAAKSTGLHVDVELCIRNADKPALDYITIAHRIKDTRKRLRNVECFGDIIVTNTPYFFHKAELFPGAWFLVGMDTFNRIMEPMYYDGMDKVCEGLSNMKDRGSKFIVYPRAGHEQKTTYKGSIVFFMRDTVEFMTEFEEINTSSTMKRQGITS